MSEDEGILTLTVDSVNDVNYSLLQVSRNLIERVIVENKSGKSYDNAILEISSEGDLLADARIDIPHIHAGESVEVDCSDVDANPNAILDLTERCIEHIDFSLMASDQLISQAQVNMTFWAFDQFSGDLELIPAFVTPNYPSLSQIIVSASEYLKKWTESPSFDGYQSGDWQRARYQAAAIFRALQEISIIYINPQQALAQLRGCALPMQFLSSTWELASTSQCFMHHALRQ